MASSRDRCAPDFDRARGNDNRIAGPHPPRRAVVASTEWTKTEIRREGRARCERRGFLTRAGSGRLSASPPPPALDHGATARAEVAPIMEHARPDPTNVRNVLLAQPHRVRFARRALLRAPLLREGRRRREREREAHERGGERGGGHNRPETQLN